MKRSHWISIIGLLMAMTAVTVLAAQLHCGRCGKVITGRYLTYNLKGQKNLTVCQDCDRKLPHCDACSLPFHAKDMVQKKGERLCKTCLANSLFCTLCDKRIEGKYYQSKDGSETYCSHCYNSYPRCMVCDRPGPVHRLSNGKTVCDQCLPTLPHCGACGQAIVGTHYKFETTDAVFCETCKAGAPKCYTCGIPLGKRHYLFEDGRRICDACNARSVYDPDQIRAIMKEVQALCVSHLGLRIEHPFDLQIKTLNNKSSAQAQKAKEGESDDSPLFGKELGLYRRMQGKSEIFLLYGLPIEMLYDTAAHEYAHAWQSENCVPGQSPEILEGFAQWVSSQILRIKGYSKALERLEERTDNPYGTGYQKIKRLEQKIGRAKMMETIKQVRQ